MTTRLTITEQIACYLQDFAEHMESSTRLEDGFLTARVIGEFSAGKTRLLRELLGEVIPPALFPVSSLERQTKLQLEITYGDRPELTLVRREEDYNPAETVKSLDRFPERHEIDEQYDPSQYRLRLAVPEERLILPNGDGFRDEKIPMRLFLIDTPGWNSGDDDLAEADAGRIMAGYHNLGLVYVTDARRLDGVTNTQRLRDFLKVLRGADFLQGAHLMMVITHCPAADGLRLQQHARDIVLDIWQELGEVPSSLTLNVLCVEFEQMNVQELQQFSNTFWKHLLAPLGEHQCLPANPWVSRINHWPPEWDIRPQLAEAEQQLERLRLLLPHAKEHGEYIRGMNKYRLLGLDEAAMRNRLKEVWLRQLGVPSTESALLGLQSRLPWPEDHPLTAWWQGYWQANMSQLLQPIKRIFDCFESALEAYTQSTEDLQSHFAAYLDDVCQQADDALDTSFTRLLQTAQGLREEPALDKVVATLLTLSLLEGRYREHYETAKAGLSPTAALKSSNWRA